jgi:hypothetical protein
MCKKISLKTTGTIKGIFARKILLEAKQEYL